MLTALVLAASIASSCSWDSPGANRFTGDASAAVQQYEMPQSIRNRLSERLRQHDFDEVVKITRDSIRGEAEYDDLREMFFGENRLCRSVSRQKWSPSAVERGLVFCEGEYCVLLPTVCGNLSRVSRVRAREPLAGGPDSLVPLTPIVLPLVELPKVTTELQPLSPLLPEESAAPALLTPVLSLTTSFGSLSTTAVIRCTSYHSPSPVPEPRTLALLAIGLLVLFWIVR